MDARWDFSTWNNYPARKLHTTLRREILKHQKLGYESLKFKKVLDDAENGRTVRVKGGDYYRMCKFIQRYHTKYHYNKLRPEPVIKYTCCRDYPEWCGGNCCSDENGCFNYLREEGCSGCSKILKKHKEKNILGRWLSYGDCCRTFKIRTFDRRWFQVQWCTTPKDTA